MYFTATATSHVNLSDVDIDVNKIIMNNDSAFVESLKSLASRDATVAIAINTKVKTAAKHKNIKIEKRAMIVARLFSQSDYNQIVKNSASQIETNDSEKVESFVARESIYKHEDNAYSVCYNKDSVYLYCHVDRTAFSQYYINDVQSTKQQVAEYLTASAAKQLLSDRVYNKEHDIEHKVFVRTIKVDNIDFVIEQ